MGASRANGGEETESSQGGTRGGTPRPKKEAALPASGGSRGSKLLTSLSLFLARRLNIISYIST